MSGEFDVKKKVKDFVADIIARNKLDPASDIHYSSGSQLGDGYASERINVEISSATATLNLYLKCLPEWEDTKTAMVLRKLFVNEANFYENIYPSFMKFLGERNVKDGFRNAPKCYGTLGSEIIAMENLRNGGYTLFDKSKVMNDDHISLVLKNFAQFHAISYAMKDQQRDEYLKLKENLYDFYSNALEIVGNDKMLINSVDEFFTKLDPTTDQKILNMRETLAKKLLDCHTSAQKNLNKYSVITKGDCWCNNMMFLYQDNTNEIPSEIMMVDWQMIREASPVFDLSYFFYLVATKEKLHKLNHYQKIYHEELKLRIKQLGSDPDILYPFTIFKEEWKKYCMSGVGVVFTVLLAMLFTDDEILKFLEENREMPSKFSKEEEYMRRMKDIIEHLIINDFLD